MRHAAVLYDSKNNIVGMTITKSGINNWIKKFGIDSVRMLNDSAADLIFANGNWTTIETTTEQLKKWRLLYGAELWIDDIQQTTEENFLMRTLYKPYKRRYSERREKPEIFEE